MKILIWHRGISVLLFDSFTDVNGTGLAAHAMNVGGGWTVLSGSYTIQGNKARGGTAATQNFAVANAGQKDVAVSAVGNTPTNAQRMGLLARVTDVNNFWWFYFDTNANSIYVYERVAGVDTARASAAQAYASNTDFALQVNVSGTRITATVNGGNVISFASMSTGLSATKHGIDTYDVGGTLDNFQVTTP